MFVFLRRKKNVRWQKHDFLGKISNVLTWKYPHKARFLKDFGILRINIECRKCNFQNDWLWQKKLFFLFLWTVLCADWRETASSQHAGQAIWGSKTGPLQWRLGDTHTHTHTHTLTHTHTHTRSTLNCHRCFVSQRTTVRRTRLTSYHVRLWSVSPSWSSTPGPRRSPGRRRRESSEPTASRLRDTWRTIQDLNCF